MATAPQVSNALLDPISAEKPAGEDLRWTPEWDRIKEARRADDDLDSGQWAKKERKASDWRQVRELTTEALEKRSKDLQLAMWLTEANIKLDGFTGLRDGLHVCRELLARYWDNGLYPPMEDGPDDRTGPLQWLNEKLVDCITAIPITARTDADEDLSFLQVQEARRVGSEASCRTSDGDVDPAKKRNYDSAIAAGRKCLEDLERALKATKRAGYEELAANFFQVFDEYKSLEKVIDEKYGDWAPNLAICRSALNDMKTEVTDILERKRKEEPDAVPVDGVEPGSEQSGDSMTVRFPLSVGNMQGSQVNGSWHEAELLVRSGQVDRGLAEMTKLAAAETCGRNRFQRKLLLAEICLGSNRDRLARSILEELAELIDKFQLDQWETSDLIASVWIRLYKIYRSSDDSDSARKLYERLCRLDPWQALACGEE